MNNSRTALKLLPPNALIKTGKVDHADWNYRLFLGYIERKRYQLILKLISGNRYDNLLEIGYGSGVFIPQLAGLSNNVYGIDIHNHSESVMRILSEHDIRSKLYSGSAETMPFEDNIFDAVISVSVLEFVENLQSACNEIKRIIKKNGHLFVVTPGYSKILDMGLRILTGERAGNDYGNKREYILPILKENFTIKREITFPKLNFGIKFYTALQLSPLK